MKKHPLTGLKVFLIDVDDTLYPADSGVWDAIKERIDLYMHERLHIPWEEVLTLRSDLFHTYGTTLRGLQITRDIDTPDFLQFVHDVPVDQLIHPNPTLAEILNRYPQRKFVFTNADRSHARRVLARLQLESCFDGIIDILDVDPYCKPMNEAFQTALEKIGVDDPHQVVFIDDGLHNLAVAYDFGLYTIRVGSPQPKGKYHHCIARLEDLPTVLDPAFVG